jgi:hypothetical protein
MDASVARYLVDAQTGNSDLGNIQRERIMAPRAFLEAAITQGTMGEAR